VRKVIPSPVLAIVAEIASQRETHSSMDSLFMYAGAPGDPPLGSKSVKAQEWLRRVNIDQSVQPLQVLGRLIENYMEELPHDSSQFDDILPSTQTSDQERLTKILARYELQYVRGGLIVGALGTPSRTLEGFVRE